MGELSKIEWTDHTFNPWWGCARVSAACRHCYAETLAVRRMQLDVWGPAAPRKLFGDRHWNDPIRWNRAAARSGTPARVFCASMADVFEDHPDLPAPRQRLFELIEQTPALRWLLLTKRPGNATAMVPGRWRDAWPSNVWFGATVEHDDVAVARIRALQQAPAAIRFLSCEPLLGPVDLAAAGAFDGPRPVNWVIVGGESGTGAREMHPDWARTVRDATVAAGAAFLFKQWGDIVDGSRVGKVAAGRVLDGRTWDQVPPLGPTANP